jgi:hypothetical protein
MKNGEFYFVHRYKVGTLADKCPMTLKHVKRYQWGFKDHVKATGTKEEK